MRRNYYEIIDSLAFDPVEMQEKKITKAIDTWKILEERNDALGAGIVDADGTKELSLAADIRACLTDKEKRKKEADAMKAKQLKKLQTIIGIMKEGAETTSPTVTGTRITNIAKTFRLDKEKTVKKAFVEAGFSVAERKTVNIASDLMISPTIYNTIRDRLAKLAAISNSSISWTGKVRNLYDLAAYTKNDGPNAMYYNKKPAAELKEIMSSGAAGVVGKLDELNHCLADLYNSGLTQVFKDEKSKQKYDNTIKLDGMTSLFDLLREIPDEMKKDPILAGVCIKRIQKQFPNPDEALAIYNAKTNQIADPFEPANGEVEYVCGSCSAMTKMKPGINKKNCSCASCGASLFVKCPGCSEYISSCADICPECDYNMTEARYFDKYLVLANTALDILDINEARIQLALATNAKPGDPKLAAVKKRLDEVGGPIEKGLKQIKVLINQKKYVKADSQLTAFCCQYPDMSVDNYRKTIDEKLKWANAAFEKVGSANDKCGACMDILDQVSDFAKAKEFLKDKKPAKLSNVSSSVSSEAGRVSLQWTGTGERGVKYCLVRKNNGRPQSVDDGVMLLEESDETQFVDANLAHGIMYYYAVFCERYGNYSEAAYSVGCIILKELDEDYVEESFEEKGTNDSCIELIWRRPNNCTGVRVLRRERGVAMASPTQDTIVVCECATNGFSDKDIKIGTNYSYRLQCVYSYDGGIKYSNGVTTSVNTIPKPKPIRFESITPIGKDTIKLSWSAGENVYSSSLDVYDAPQNTNIVAGTIYHNSAVAKLGNRLSHISNVAGGGLTLTLAQKKNYRLFLAVSCGDYSIVSNIISVSNSLKLDIDKSSTMIFGNMRLVIRMKEEIPESMVALRYAFRVKMRENESAPWCTVDDVESMGRITLEEYRRIGGIVITPVPLKELYITVIGEYKLGSEVYFTEPARYRISNKPKAQIKYSIEWNKRKPRKLIFECNESLDIPELFLCTSRVHPVPPNQFDPNNINLCLVGATHEYQANTKMEVAIPENLWFGAVKKHAIRLFVKDEYLDEFELVPDAKTTIIP